MSRKLVVLQGKVFFVELLSMPGSTNYSWCVKSMPKEIVCTGMENIPMRQGIGPVMQRFYFAAVSAENLEVEIEFLLANLSNIAEVSKEFKASLSIIPSNSDEFVSYSENEADQKAVCGIFYTGDNTFQYGYSCEMQNVVKNDFRPANDSAQIPYGYVCDRNDANLKYGYPCGYNDANLKYGYPCGYNDANLKYGYPCGYNDANLKYGYPCMEYTKDSRPYGYVMLG